MSPLNPFRDMPFPGTGLPEGYRSEGKRLVPENLAVPDVLTHQPSEPAPAPTTRRKASKE